LFIALRAARQCAAGRVRGPLDSADPAPSFAGCARWSSPPSPTGTDDPVAVLSRSVPSTPDGVRPDLAQVGSAAPL